MIKLIYKLKASTNHADGTTGRTAGLSEGHYLPVDEIRISQGTVDLATDLMNKRAACLPANAQIYGQTYVFVGTNKPSVTTDRRFPGTSTLQNDIPQAAVKVTMNSRDTNNKKELKVALIPDARTVQGEYRDAEGYNARLNAYFQALHGRWGFRGLQLDAPAGELFSIAANGVVTFMNGANPAGIATGDFVRFLGAVDTLGNAMTGTFKVRILEGAFYLINWQGTNPRVPIPDVTRFATGRIMKNVKIFCTYHYPGIELEPPTACTRKVGSPTDKYVGRRSKKR